MQADALARPKEAPIGDNVALSWKGTYDPRQDVLYCAHNAGFFSTCCVALWNLADLQRSLPGRLPARVDFSLAFRSFRNPEQLAQKTDLYPLFFKPGQAATGSIRTLRHISHHGLYRFLNYARLKPVLDRYFQPSDQAQALKAELARRYGIDPNKTLAVVYRGTDKGTEIKVASPEDFLALTRRLLILHPGYRVWIQTDELEVRKMFCRAFGERCFFLHEMPVSSNGLVVHAQGDDALKMDRSEFGLMLVAVTSLLAEIDVVVNHTGNMGLWLCLFRGHARGVWQFDDEGLPASPAILACCWAAARRFTIKAVRKLRKWGGLLVAQRR